MALHFGLLASSGTFLKRCVDSVLLVEEQKANIQVTKMNNLTGQIRLLEF